MINANQLLNNWALNTSLEERRITPIVYHDKNSMKSSQSQRINIKGKTSLVFLDNNIKFYDVEHEKSVEEKRGKA